MISEREIRPGSSIGPTMLLFDFVEFHAAALETNEARHNIILAILARAVSDPDPNVGLWTLGAPGQCAVQTPGRPIVLGDFDQAQSRLLAETTADLELSRCGRAGPNGETLRRSRVDARDRFPRADPATGSRAERRAALSGRSRPCPSGRRGGCGSVRRLDDSVHARSRAARPIARG